MKKKADCLNFRPLPTNPDVCAKWIRPALTVKTGWQSGSLPQPFCQVEEKCPSLGLRLTPRADQMEEVNHGQ